MISNAPSVDMVLRQSLVNTQDMTHDDLPSSPVSAICGHTDHIDCIVAVLMIAGRTFFILSALRLLVFHLFVQIKKRFSPVYPSCFENLFDNFSLVNIIVYIRTVCKHLTFVFHMLMFY